MRRELVVAFALIASLLVVSAAPVSASHTVQIETADSASELNTGTSTNSETERSGDPAVVGHDLARSSAVARWAFDNGSGSTAYDHVGSNDGTITGATWVSGKSGQALDFDGAGEVSLSAVTEPASQNAVTLTAWVYIDASTGQDQFIISNRQSGANTAYSLIYDDSETKFAFQVKGSTLTFTKVNSENVTTGRWYHVAGTWDGSELKIYLNGTVNGSASASGSLYTPDATTIGDRSEGGNDVDGKIDEPRIYSAALSPGLINRLATYPNAKLSATASERWAFDNGSGTTAFGDEGNDGTINGGPAWVSGKSGQALDFDGSSDYVDTSGAEGSSFPRTLSTWVKPQGNSTGYVFAESDDGPDSDEIIGLQITGAGLAKVLFRGNTLTSVTATGSTDLRGGWHHIGAVVTASEVRLYVDGALVDSTAHSRPYPTTDTIQIGRLLYGGGDVGYYNGSVDDPRVYNSELTAEDFQYLYNNPGAQLNETSRWERTFSVERSVEGSVTFDSLTNTSATVRFETPGGSVLSSAIYTSNGTKTQTWAESSATSVVLNVSYNATDVNPNARLDSATVSATTREPVIDNSSASPNSSSTTISTDTPTLSVDISDADFSTTQGDSVTVTFVVDGSVDGTDTLTSNGTASITASSLTGGAHTWKVYADDGEHNISSATFDIAVPDELVFRNESNASERVPVAVSVTFIGSDTIVEKTGSENISLSNLPVGSEMVVVVQAAGWTDRTVILSDIFTQSDVYLLNDSLTTTTTVFTVEDRTGQYPTGEAELVVERIINQSGTPDWRTVQAEKITGAGILVEMERGERYRFKIRDDDGTVTDLGHITASAEFDGATVNLIVSTTSGTLDEFGGLYAWNTSYEVRDSASDRIRFDFEMVDPSFEADDFRLIVSYQSNGTEVSNVSYGDGVTDLSAFVTLPSDSEIYRVAWSATIGGEAYSGTRLVGAGRGTLGEGFCGTALESVWCERIALGGLLVVAGLFSAFNVAVGGVVLSSLAGFAWYFGALPSSIGAGAIILGFGLSGLYAAAKGGFR